MTEAQQTLTEFKNLLSIYAVNAKAQYFLALRELMRGVNGRALTEAIGCDNDCPLCRWGKADAEPWENHCRLWTFGEMLEDCDPGFERGNNRAQRAAVELLEFIENQEAPC